MPPNEKVAVVLAAFWLANATVPGPLILARLRPDLPSLLAKYLPGDGDVDELCCLGLLWKETDQCSAWWHALDHSWPGVANEN